MENQMTFSIEIDIVNTVNPCCGNTEIQMENILDRKNKCAKCQKEVQAEADIEIFLLSKMVVNSIQTVKLIRPNKLRSEIENMLMMGFDLNLIH
jgi:hypothetical protein